MQKEIWKDVPTWEGYYQVSNVGRVRSITRVVTDSKGRKRKWHGVVLSPVIDYNGYMNVTLCKSGFVYRVKVHQLVAMVFMGHVRNGFVDVIDHIDGDKQNNIVSNLEIVSMMENSSRAVDKTKTSSVYTGVEFNKKQRKWRAHIRYNAKKRYLGSYYTEEDAYIARKKAEKEVIDGKPISIKKKSSKYKGVYFSARKRLWCAQFAVTGKTVYIGAFKSEKEAKYAYDSYVRSI